MKRRNVLLDDDIEEDLKQIAELDHINPAAFIRAAIRKALTEHKEKRDGPN